MFTRKLTDEERRLLQKISDEAYDQFITEVAEGRELERITSGNWPPVSFIWDPKRLSLAWWTGSAGSKKPLTWRRRLPGWKSP